MEKEDIIRYLETFEEATVGKLSTVGTFETFCDAVTIWINKPHVVNRRLCGSKVLYQDSTSEEDLSGFIKKCLSSSERPEQVHTSVDLEEVPSLSSIVDVSFYFVLREVFYKQVSQVPTKEVILIGKYLFVNT